MGHYSPVPTPVQWINKLKQNRVTHVSSLFRRSNGNTVERVNKEIGRSLRTIYHDKHMGG